MVNPLESIFPGLAKGVYAVTSAQSKRYNCVAWAAGDTDNWWWPGPNTEVEHWPAAVTRAETLDAFREVFATLGYVVCQGEDLDPGFEKIALFAGNQGDPRHATMQLSTGRWTSKLGNLEDIEHALRDLEGIEYGAVVLVMKRPIVGGQIQ
jgi:hypothetical protein